MPISKFTVLLKDISFGISTTGRFIESGGGGGGLGLSIERQEILLS